MQSPSLCKPFFIKNSCRLKEAGQKKDIFHNDFFTTSFSKRLSHNVFLPLFRQCLVDQAETSMLHICNIYSDTV